MCIWGLYCFQIVEIAGFSRQSAENMQIFMVQNIEGHAFKASRWQAFSKQYKKSG